MCRGCFHHGVYPAICKRLWWVESGALDCRCSLFVGLRWAGHLQRGTLVLFEQASVKKTPAHFLEACCDLGITRCLGRLFVAIHKQDGCKKSMSDEVEWE